MQTDYFLETRFKVSHKLFDDFGLRILSNWTKEELEKTILFVMTQYESNQLKNYALDFIHKGQKLAEGQTILDFLNQVYEQEEIENDSNLEQFNEIEFYIVFNELSQEEIQKKSFQQNNEKLLLLVELITMTTITKDLSLNNHMLKNIFKLFETIDFFKIEEQYQTYYFMIQGLLQAQGNYNSLSSNIKKHKENFYKVQQYANLKIMEKNKIEPTIVIQEKNFSLRNTRTYKLFNHCSTILLKFLHKNHLLILCLILFLICSSISLFYPLIFLIPIFCIMILDLLSQKNSLYKDQQPTQFYFLQISTVKKTSFIITETLINLILSLSFFYNYKFIKGRMQHFLWRIEGVEKFFNSQEIKQAEEFYEKIKDQVVLEIIKMLMRKLKLIYKVMQRTIASTGGKVEENLVCSDKSYKLTLEQIQRRNEIFEKLLQLQKQKIEELPKHEISVTLPDGKIMQGKSLETTPLIIAKSISKKLALNAVVAKVVYQKRHTHYFEKVTECEAESHEHNEEKNEQLIGLNTPLEGDCKLWLLDFSSDEGKQTFWHSSAHLLGRSMEQLYGAFLTHGPPLQHGYYYDSFIGNSRVQKKDYEEIEKKMQEIVQKKVDFEQILLTKEQALELFQDNPFKVKLIQAKIKDGDRTSAYRSGDLIDLCTGPHIDNASKIKAIKIDQDSSSFWLGNQSLDVLQRIYGLAFPSKKELKEYLDHVEELKKRDHKNIGPNQKLFFFHPYAPGCPFFLPHGARVFNRLVELIKNEYFYRGFSEVITPTMFKNELWKTSGHYFKYAKDMFFTDSDKEKHGIKPMNCPSHCLMFKQSLKSYRDLPVRYADFGVLHRNEVSGALTGLTRVRKFHQDDAHIFCRPDQIEEEVMSQLEFISHIYGLLGFEFTYELSTRPDNFIGDIEIWNQAEESLKNVLNKTGKSWKVNPGDGAFYGPKIDYKVQDCFGRMHQLGTVQLDFNLPQRFNLQYKTKVNEQKEENDKKEEQEEEQEQIQEIEEEEDLEAEQKKYSIIKPLKSGFERPVIIHRAILGSLERCIAILIEHFGGKWPFWLSPRQIAIIPVSQKFEDYAYYLQEKLQLKKYYVDVDMNNETLNKRVRNMQLEGYNYMLIVGEQEVNNYSVNIRKRDVKDPIGEMSIQEFYDFLEKEEPEASALYNRQKQRTLAYALKDLDIDLIKKMSDWDMKLKYQNFIEGEGLVMGESDKVIMKELEGIKIDSQHLPNLFRWQKICEKLENKQ